MEDESSEEEQHFKPLRRFLGLSGVWWELVTKANIYKEELQEEEKGGDEWKMKTVKKSSISSLWVGSKGCLVFEKDS